MKFYGREIQRKKLQRIYNNSKHQVVLVYGRRRIGKSELIKQSLRESSLRSIYFECKQTTELNNVDSLAVLMAEIFHFPKPDFKSLEELLDYLFQAAKKEALILVLDEYPYIRETSKGIDSILQFLSDKYRDTSKLKLVLCGSYVDTMKAMLAKENPLYGRVDLVVDLKAMDYYESALFYADFVNEDKVKLYSVFGGVPYYNKLIDPDLSVKENIIELIASPGARLENEVSMYIKSEISKINNANEVFEALAKGFCKFNDLLSQSHVSSSPTLVDVLEKLMHMEVVQKQTPINEPNNKRKASYHISDNFSLFYYKYIYRYLSQLSIMDSDIFYDKYIAKDFRESYVPGSFETICKQYLIRQNLQGKLAEPIENIGKYYYDDPKQHTNGEFDIVTQDARGYIFYEAKFRNEPLSTSQIKKEIMQVEATGLDCYKYGFFSKSGYALEPDSNMVFYSLDDLYR